MASNNDAQESQDSSFDDETPAPRQGFFGRIGALFKRTPVMDEPEGSQSTQVGEDHPPPTEAEAKQAQRRMMYLAIKAEMDKDPGLRDDCRGLAKLEQTLKVLGLAGVMNMPSRIQRMALDEFDTCFGATSDPGLLAVREVLIQEINESNPDLGSVVGAHPSVAASIRHAAMGGTQTFGSRPSSATNLPVLSSMPSGNGMESYGDEPDQRYGGENTRQAYGTPDHDDDEPDGRVMHLGTAADFENSRTAELEIYAEVSTRGVDESAQAVALLDPTNSRVASPLPTQGTALHFENTRPMNDMDVSTNRRPALELEVNESLADDYFTPGVGQVALGPEVMESHDPNAFASFSNSMPALIELEIEGGLDLPSLKVQKSRH